MWQTKEHDKIANSTQAFQWKHTNSSAYTREVNRAIALRQKWRTQYHVIKHGFPAIFHILRSTRFRVMGDGLFILTAFISLKLTELMTFIFKSKFSTLYLSPHWLRLLLLRSLLKSHQHRPFSSQIQAKPDRKTEHMPFSLTFYSEPFKE